MREFLYCNDFYFKNSVIASISYNEFRRIIMHGTKIFFQVRRGRRERSTRRRDLESYNLLIETVLLNALRKRSPNDNIVDDNNLSDGELELGEAVISVNQYIVQPMAGQSDVNFPASGMNPISDQFVNELPCNDPVLDAPRCGYRQSGQQTFNRNAMSWSKHRCIFP